MTIDQKFRDSAVEAYNEKSESKCKDFADLQLKLKKCTDALCKDQYFGQIRIGKSTATFCEWITPPVYLHSKKKNEKEKEKNDLQKKRNENAEKISSCIQNERLNTIVIVLESPHTDEFLKIEDEWKAIGPACGDTGENLYKWLPEVLLNYVPCIIDRGNNFRAEHSVDKEIEKTCYAIRLVNAIPYQCSLGVHTAKYRDDLFNKLWKNKLVKEEFVKRLKTSQPSIIINCCTKGYKIKEEKDELRYLVQKEINAYNKIANCLLLRAAHPSSYHFKNGLSLVDED